MKFVDMNDVAFDETSVAFPGLGNCHGIILTTTQGMFAYHAGGSATDSAGKAEAFSMFVKAHAQGGTKALCLYGVCPEMRYLNLPKNAHKVELQMVAGFLGFTGPIRGYRWNAEKLGWTTAYVEVQFNRTNPTFYFENFSKCTSDTGKNTSPQDHKFVRQTMIRVQNQVAKEFVACSCTTKAHVVVKANRQFTGTGKFHTTRKL